MSPGELIFMLMTSTCVCGVVDSCSFTALQGGSVTLELKFPSEIALKPLHISCEQDLPGTNQPSREFFQQFNDKEDKSFQTDHFRGRVQVERAGLRDGLFRANISALRLDDSGVYSCNFYSSEGRNSSKCQLSVTDAPAEVSLPRPIQGPEEPTESIQTGSRHRLGLYPALGLWVILMFVLIIRCTFSAAPNKPPPTQCDMV